MTATNVIQQPSAIDRIFGAVVEPQTWRNVLYLFISFPLGIFYFCFTVVGVSAGMGLFIVAIGVPLLVFTLMVVGQFARLERLLLRNLLGATVRERARFVPPPGIVESLKAYLGRADTWKAVVYVLVHLPFCVIGFSLLMAFIPAALVLLATPLIFPIIPIDVFMTRVTTFDQAVLCSSLGAILALVGLHILNGWAALWKRAGAALLE